ncbi:uncharacterized protein A1O9_11684 [Exophiala aquamarina CBS 119918]|uniref:E3 ubiquitin-protein ligase listerin n=1 Tax=Exophiala aquamarina CBS 119918 TaxID=1182545 RepID=A0A072NZI3_9EURO|nr:uncharacterized protein A1O9_11684 [Exophiala aquamarina CBS 119918]KEF52443.1 hypothetical protein A1O9_11684 [Exophiala aquamarina CBS 119918]
MSKKFKSQASSARAASAFAFGAASSPSSSFGNAFQTAPSSLSYIAEFPDLSTISDPNVVVSLRNLGKKDSTTKSKALQELQDHISSSTAIEPGLLEAWVSLYPRTSIDNSRRVRQLAHVLQGSVTAASGKRIAPHLPRVIGSWLSAAYDSDKAVARAAQESITISFPTDEKRRALWKVYKDALVEYAEDAILTQTAQTLSDERSTSLDDAETKFVRVVSTAMHMLTQTIRANLNHAAPTPQNLRQLVCNKKLWDYAHHHESTLRKGLYSLVTLSISKFTSDLDWNVISGAFIGKALHTSQLGSTTQLSEALFSLTGVRPQMWTSDYSGKTTPTKRLNQYLRGGSQHGSDKFWANTALLLPILPPQVLSPNSENGTVNVQDATLILESLRASLSNGDEPRHNLEIAWTAYMDIASWFLGQLSQVDSKDLLFKDNLLLLVLYYVSPDTDDTTWALPGPSGLKMSSRVLSVALLHGLVEVFQVTWSGIAQAIADAMKLSLPESSADFKKSQDSVVAQSQRFLRLRAFVLRDSHPDDSIQSQVMEILRQTDDSLLVIATQTLKARNGKPYGAAAFLESLTAQTKLSESTSLAEFLVEDAQTLFDSPSAEYLIAIELQSGSNLAQAISVLTSPDLTGYKANALARLLSQGSDSDLSQHGDLAQFVSQQVSRNLDEGPVQVITKAVLQNSKLKNSAISRCCFEQLLGQLSSDTDPRMQYSVLKFLSSLFTPSVVSLPTLSEALGKNLLMSLLILSDSHVAEVAELSGLLASRIKSFPAVGDSSIVVSSNELIAEQLSGHGTHLPILALVDSAQEELAKAKPGVPTTYSSLLPSNEQWSAALEPHLSGTRDLSLAITSPLQGLVFLLERDSKIQPLTLSKDADEFSLLFRLTLYVSKLLSVTTISTHLSGDQMHALYANFPLAIQLLNEKLTLDSANELWYNTTLEVADEAAAVLSQGSTLLQVWSQNETMARIWSDIIRSSSDFKPRSYIHGLAFADVISRYIARHDQRSVLASFEKDIARIHRSPDLVKSVSLLSATHEYVIGSQQGRKLLNELIVLCTELKSSDDHALIMRRLVLLNALLAGSSDALDVIPNQRVVFLMQALVRLLDSPASTFGLKAEVAKLLSPVLSATAEIYGDHWERILDWLCEVWQNENDQNSLPLLHASLRLYGRLRTLSSLEDASEDISDAWTSKKPQLEDGLKQCLESFSQSTPGINQPRRITAELLRRHIMEISPSHDPNLYLLITSTEDAVRGAAYDLLHRSIPPEQESISLELALDHRTVHLPTDLMNILTDGPNASVPNASVPNSSSNTSQQSYLLGWHLLFDHFTTASYKLREAYGTDIKAHDILPGLLTLICDICRITGGRPLDVSKFNIRTFELNPAETEKMQDQLLVVHLYYCCLLYLPSLTRSWFIDQKNRVKSPLEGWTQRYFSSLLTSAAITTVTAWVASQPQGESDAPIVVKSSTNGSEIIASITVDPESPPISLAISLPSSYPLDSPTVSSRTRVGVSEKNWQSWLRTFQIIIFSTGSIIEGLIAFRRNVQGALKGQSECAICYSIIGTDMQTPNKRCGTCRNTFHSVCLFRWFKSSNSSSCPLCRNNFNYA